MVDRDGWHFTNNGKYTVKSGYPVERVYPYRKRPPLLFGPTVDVLNAFRWKIWCPPKIKHFLWQFVTWCIAVKKNMRARGIQGDICCARWGIDKPYVFLMFSSTSGLGSLKDTIKSSYFPNKLSLHKHKSSLPESFSADGWSSVCMDTMVHLERKE